MMRRPTRVRHGWIAALLALCLTPTPAPAQIDPVARGMAGAAGANASAALTIPRTQFGGSIVGACDSLTANAVNFNSSSSGVDTWYPKAVFTQLVALSGGRLRPVRINPTGSGAASGGWPVAGGNFGQTVQVLVARGGSGYNPATTSISFASSGGGASPTATPVITNGVITGVTITSAGYYSTVGPQATITDTSGSGSGAVLTSIITGSGEYAVGGLDTVQAEAFIPGIIASGAKNVLWMCGTNNLSNPSNGAGNASGTGYTLAQTQASVLKSINAFVAAGPWTAPTATVRPRARTPTSCAVGM
jgi:hypothetical protein